MQTDILDGCPDDREATGLRGEHVDLIGALSHIAEQALNSIGGLNVSVHRGGELVKGQQVIFVLRQAAHRFGIALAYLALKAANWVSASCFARLAPNANEFGLYVATLASRDGVEARCVAYARDSVGEAWPQTAARPQRAVHHAHPSR